MQSTGFRCLEQPVGELGAQPLSLPVVSNDEPHFHSAVVERSKTCQPKDPRLDQGLEQFVAPLIHWRKSTCGLVTQRLL